MTSPDFRAAFALDAKDLLALRTLCDHVEDDEFQTVMIITIVGIAELLDTARKEKAEASCPDLFRTMFMSSSDTSSSASSSSYNQMCPRQMCPRGLNESMSISSLSGGSSSSHDDNALEIDTAFANQPMPMYTYSDEDLDDLSSSKSDIDPILPPMFTSLRESALYQVKAVFPNFFDDDFETLSIKDIGELSRTSSCCWQLLQQKQKEHSVIRHCQCHLLQ
jgi:hypothetical protein